MLVMKTKLFTIVTLIVALLAGTVTADTTYTPIAKFSEICGDYEEVRTVRMVEDNGLNLLFRDLDPNTPDLPVGLDRSYWHFCYLHFEGSFAWAVGWGQNGGVYLPGKSGYISGKYTEWLKYDLDLIPDEIIIVRDSGQDGPGEVSPSGDFRPRSDDTQFSSKDVLFGPEEIRGDISQLPPWEDKNPLELPKMVMKPFTDMVDLITMTEFWICDCNEDNAWCNGQDWNYDGIVNLADFAILAKKWLAYEEL